ncbi:7556_t:CDS:2, partial [Paraglomus brasilianum]
ILNAGDKYTLYFLQYLMEFFPLTVQLSKRREAARLVPPPLPRTTEDSDSSSEDSDSLSKDFDSSSKDSDSSSEDPDDERSHSPDTMDVDTHKLLEAQNENTDRVLFAIPGRDSYPYHFHHRLLRCSDGCDNIAT